MMEDYDFQFISQPLTDENGFLNEACINELNAAIKSIPRTYERLSSDPEWNTPRVTCIRHITGALAYWAIRQCFSDKNEIPCPPDIEKVVSYLYVAIRKRFNKFGWAELSLCDISKMLYDILYDQNISSFDQWNTDECLGSSWIDLDALLHNVCLTVRDERRVNDEFNRRFEAEHGPLTL